MYAIVNVPRKSIVDLSLIDDVPEQYATSCFVTEEDGLAALRWARKELLKEGYESNYKLFKLEEV